jgi:hypothetical protein
MFTKDRCSKKKEGGEDKSLGQVREERQGWVGNILR